MSEGAAVRIRIRHSLTRSLRLIDRPACGHRIPVDADGVEKGLPVGVRRQKRREHRRPGGHQRPSRPPHMQVVGRRQRRHRAPFPGALLAERRDRQPVLDESAVGHRRFPGSVRPGAGEEILPPHGSGKVAFGVEAAEPFVSGGAAGCGDAVSLDEHRDPPVGGGGGGGGIVSVLAFAEWGGPVRRLVGWPAERGGRCRPGRDQGRLRTRSWKIRWRRSRFSTSQAKHSGWRLGSCQAMARRTKMRHL